MLDKLTILQRLQAGEITAEEALALMNQAQEGPTPPTAHSSQSNGQAPVDSRQINPDTHHAQHSTHFTGQSNHQEHYGHHDHHQEPGWADSLFGWIGEVVDEVTSEFKDMDISANISDVLSGTFSHNKRSVNFVSKPILQSLAQLELHGKNDKIEIHGYEGDCIQIQCDYDARYPDAYVHFHEENGTVALLFEDKTMRSVRVLCKVPRVQIGHLIAATKNDRIHLVDVTASDISLETKNDNIYVEAVNCGSLSAQTRNGNIKTRAISGGNIHLETTNSKITAEDIHAQSLTLITTNAGVKTAAIDSINTYIKTTNTGLKLEETMVSSGPLFWDGERSLEAYTTNGGIRFLLPEGIGLSVEANASGGKVNCNVPLYSTEGNKSYVKGESINYSTTGRRLNVKLHTTNANIKIRG